MRGQKPDIASKDSLSCNLKNLDKWLQSKQEIYLVIDEAHNAIAKSYRKIVDYIKTKVQNVKLLGLTATPFRTAENEKGLLQKVFQDGFVACLLNKLFKTMHVLD